MSWGHYFKSGERCHITDDYGGPRGVRNWYNARGISPVTPYPLKDAEGVVEQVLNDGVSPCYKVRFDGFAELFLVPIHDLMPS